MATHYLFMVMAKTYVIGYTLMMDFVNRDQPYEGDFKKLVETRMCVDCNLQGGNLSGLDLSGVNLTEENLIGTKFCKTIMPDRSVNNSGC